MGIQDSACPMVPIRTKGLAIRETAQQLHGGQLCCGADQLRNRREDPELKRPRLQQQGESGQVMFAAALRDGLRGSVKQAIAPAV